MTAAEVAALGPGLASRMSMEQLEAAVLLFTTLGNTTTQNVVSIPDLRQAFVNHMRGCMRMPRGGALAGGSQQTGFEIPLVSGDSGWGSFAVRGLAEHYITHYTLDNTSVGSQQ